MSSVAPALRPELSLQLSHETNLTIKDFIAEFQGDVTKLMCIIENEVAEERDPLMAAGFYFR
jgi:hypothetical protein